MGREIPTNVFFGGSINQPNMSTGSLLDTVTSPMWALDMDGTTALVRHNQPEGCYIGGFHSGNARKLVIGIGCSYSYVDDGFPVDYPVWVMESETGPAYYDWAAAASMIQEFQVYYPSEAYGDWSVNVGCGTTVDPTSEYSVGSLRSLGMLADGNFSYTPFVDPIYCDYVVLRAGFNAGPLNGFIRDFAWYTSGVAPTGTPCLSFGVGSGNPGPGPGPGSCG